MKKKELIELNKGLIDVSKLEGVKFAYAVAKNKAKIKSELESLVESIKPSEKFQEHEIERVKICENHAKKDDNDQVVIKEDRYVIVNEKKLNSEIKKLMDKNKEIIDQRKKQLKEYEDLLDEDSTIEFHKIKLDQVPDNITGEQLEAILCIVDE